MESHIEEYGLYRDCEDGYEEDESYQQEWKEVKDLLTSLSTFLPEEQKNKIETLRLLIARLSTAKNLHSFKKGFKEGLYIACETFIE